MQRKAVHWNPKAIWAQGLNLRLCKRIVINIWTLPVILFSIYGGFFCDFAAAYSVALIHELAHVLCAGFLGIGISHITFYPFGMCATLSDGYITDSYKEFFTAFAGPLSNIVMFFLCFFLHSINNAVFLVLCMNINIAMCVLNLIPILPLDGGRMLKSLLSPTYGIIRSYNFVIRISRFFVCILLITAAAVFIANDFNFSLVLVTAFLLQNLCSEQRSLTIVTVREILKRKSAFETENRECRSKTLCVNGSTPARSILKYISFDCIYIIHVTDKRGRITAVLTETQVLDALCRDGIRVLYGAVARQTQKSNFRNV